MDADGGLGFADWVAGRRLSFGACKRQRRTDGQGSGAGWVAKVACACAVLLVPSMPSSLPFLPLPFSRLSWSRGALERCAEQHGSGPDFSCGPCGRQRRTGRRGLGVAGLVAGQGVLASPCNRQRRTFGQALDLAGFLVLPFLPVQWPRGALERCAGQRISGVCLLRGLCGRQRRTRGQGLGAAGSIVRVACACAVLLLLSLPASLPFPPLPFSRLPSPRGALERCLGQRRLGPDFSCRSCGRQRRTGRRGLGVAGWIAGQGVLPSPCNRQRRTFGQALDLAGLLVLPFLPLPSPRGALERCAEQHISGPGLLRGPCGRQRITLGQGLGVAVLRVVAYAVLGASAVRVAACASDGACHGACERIRLAWP